MLLPLSNTPRDYAWGSMDAIARLQGREPSGAPEAEVWFGDHPGAPALVLDGSSRTLDQWIVEAGAEAGVPGPLGFLVKILAAASPLSIQAHPSIEQAVEGFDREDAEGVPQSASHRNYKDRNHKPETIVALSDPFIALSGFRAPAATLELLREIGGAGAEAIASRIDSGIDLARLVAWLLSAGTAGAGTGGAGAGGAEAAEAVADFEAAVIERGAAADASPEVRTLAQIAAHYPGDPGLAVAALLNRVQLSPGEAIFTPAGSPHAYLEGLGIEVMAASDNVMRGGLTPKHIDVDELVSVLDPSPSGSPRMRPAEVEPGVWRYDPPVPDFRIVRIDAAARRSAGEPGAARLSVDAPLIVVALASGARLGQGDAGCELGAGQACFVTPGSPVRIEGDAIAAFGASQASSRA